jgi:hypothetical protein
MMTNGSGDEAQRAEAAADAEDTYRLRVTDAVLSELVGVCDDSDFSMAVSVQAGGYLVSGVLISSIDYFGGLAGLIRGAGGQQAPQQALDAVAGLFDTFAEQQQRRRERRVALLQNANAQIEPDDRVRPVYLHLRNAALIGPAGDLATIPYWRGRLDHVDAFWLGSLSTRQAER